MLCSFAVATAEFVLVGLLPEIAADLSVSVPAAGLLVTVYMVVVTVGGPAAIVLTRRLPRRRPCSRPRWRSRSAAAVVSALARYVTACCSLARLGSALGAGAVRRGRVAGRDGGRGAGAADRRGREGVQRLRPGHRDRAAGRHAGRRRRTGGTPTFVVVAGSARCGLVGVLVVCPRGPGGRPRSRLGPASAPDRAPARSCRARGDAAGVHRLRRRVHLRGADAAATVAGFSPGWVSVALVGLRPGHGRRQRGRRAGAAAADRRGCCPCRWRSLAVVLARAGRRLRRPATALAEPVPCSVPPRSWSRRCCRPG